jgi:hypothetical protein
MSRLGGKPAAIVPDNQLSEIATDAQFDFDQPCLSVPGRI